MKRFKVGDMARIVHVGKQVGVLEPYIGTVCEIMASPAVCDCIHCLIEHGFPGGVSDYEIKVCSGEHTHVMDDQLAPIADPDAHIHNDEQEELHA